MEKQKAEAVIFLLIGAIILSCHKPLPIPKPVNLLSPLNQSVLRKKTVDFYWQKVDEAISYQIQVDKKINFIKPLINDSTLTDTSFKSELNDGDYYWRVRSLSADSVWSEWSKTWSFKIERYQIKSVILTYGYAHDVFIDEPYAYIADGQAGLTILDIEEPENPYIVGNIMDTLHEAWGVVVEDEYAYVAYGSAELWILDISEPESLWVVGALEYPTPASGYDIFIQDSLVYIAAMSQFIIANVRDPRYPDLMFQARFPANVRGVSVIDSFACIACEQLGIYIYNVANLRQTRIIGWCDTKGNARDVFIKDSLAFVADGTNGLVVINIKDKNNPTIIGSLDLPGYARKIFINDLLYIALGDSGLGVVDITNPASPKIDAIVKTGYAYSVFATDDYIYVANGRNGLTIIGKEGK